MTSSRELLDILKTVSRSFFISIKFLPGKVRLTIALAYLLARASDTIADTNVMAPRARTGFLADFLIRVRESRDLSDLEVRPFLEKQAEGAEKELLLHINDIIRHLQMIPKRHRELVTEVLSKIIQGQSLDIERFETEPGAHKLPDGRSLEEYTYFVAGSVGEFWTKLCLLEWPRYSRSLLSTARLLRLGREFGQGLQLINILRDFPGDLQQGRCYLPVSNLDEVVADPNVARSEWEHWRQQTLSYLESAWEYVDAVRPPRIRFACAVPLFVGIRTLALLGGEPRLRPGMKISRSEVRSLMGWAAAYAWLPLRKTWIRRKIFNR
jgi:farnesyl-diphosphate farnesyltransferase